MLNLPYVLGVVALFLVGYVVSVSGFFGKKRRSNLKPPPGPRKYPFIGCIPSLMKYRSFTDYAKAITEKYGKIVSTDMGPSKIVVITDFDTFSEAYKHKNFQGRPHIPSFTARREGNGEFNGISSNDGPIFKEQKRFGLRNFKEGQAVESMAGEAVTNVVQYLKKRLHTPVDSQRVFVLAVFTSILKTLTGIVQDLEDPDVEPNCHAYTNGDDVLFTSHILAPYNLFPTLSEWFPRLSGLKVIQDSFKAGFVKIQAALDAHKAVERDRENPRDFMEVYLNQIENTTDPHSGFYGAEADKNLRASVLDILGASTGGLTQTIGYMWLIVGHHPEVRRRIQEEVDQVVGKDRAPRLEDRPNMPYTEATIAEMFRKHSLTHIGTPHTITEDTEFQGYFLEKDTLVVSWTYGMHYDKTFWGEDVDVFRPERFLIPDKEDSSRSVFDREKNRRVVPFGVGPRTCFGETLARKVIFLYLTTLLQQFDYHFEQQDPPPTLELTERFLLLPPKYNIVFTQRQQIDATPLSVAA